LESSKKLEEKGHHKGKREGMKYFYNIGKSIFGLGGLGKRSGRVVDQLGPW
jgi:hypothetical protein